MRRRRRPIDCARKRPLGYSLVEVVISVLLVSVIVTGVFGVALTSKSLNGQNGKNDRYQIAGQATKEISTALRNFVSGCCDVVGGTCRTGAVTYTCSPISGPNMNNSGDMSWSFNNYPLSSGPVTDTSVTGSRYYALAEGVHNLTGVLPAWFTAAPYNATVSYTVGAGYGASGIDQNWSNPATYPTAGDSVMPAVTFNVTWTEPTATP